jgi:predicted RNA-binding Zn-ribbon protein involved in translation (DUF1610 family)
MFVCKTCSAHLSEDLSNKSCPFCGEQFGPVARPAAVRNRAASREFVIVALVGGFVTVVLFCSIFSSLARAAFSGA